MVYRKYHIFIILLIGLVACSPRAVHEAQRTVAVADSMRAEGQMYGVDEGDSAALAQAYSALHAWRIVCPTDYAHACYHYGRLLRAKEYPASAMECFIRATHSRTRDYHILGRVYNNIGDICHIAGEYDLSYDMFERSANEYLTDGDTLSYYYCLNDMAFELAEQKKTKEAIILLANIVRSCSDGGVVAKTMETKAELYKQIQRYDSAIYYVNQLLSVRPSEYTGLVIKAQAYDKLGLKDSALLYANKVMDLHPVPIKQYNVLYICAHADSTLSENEILELTSIRDDIHTYELDVHKKEHARAVEVLLQEEKQYKDKQHIIIVIFILIFLSIIVGAGYLVYVNRKQKHIATETAKAEEQNRIMSQLMREKQANYQKQKEKLERNCRSLREIDSIKSQLSWNDYKKMSAIIDANFAFLSHNLQTIYHLRENEIRLCVLILIDGFTSKQQAELLYYAESGIRNFKSNTAKKLGTNSSNMHDFLVKMVLG